MPRIVSFRFRLNNTTTARMGVESTRLSRSLLRQRMGCVHVSGIPETCYIGGVEEGSYRQSRLCRLLGNPVAFAVFNCSWKFFLRTPLASRLLGWTAVASAIEAARRISQYSGTTPKPCETVLRKQN